PSHNASEINPDTRLRITFDNTPSIQTGEVQIFDAASNSLVDSINVQKDTDTLGFSGQTTTRVLNLVPVQVVGKSILINPHSNRLQYGKRYSVVIGNGVFSGTLAGRSFMGFSAGQWQFTTKAAGPSGASLSVDDDGPADFGSLQGALNYVMKNLPGSTAATINVRNGTYPEPLYLRDKSNLRIVGESRDGTQVRFANYEGLNPGTNGRPLFLIQGGDLISLENITLFNTHQRAFAATGSQAEVLYFGSDSGRLIAKNAAFISEQDTLQLRGYSWFYNSVIAGNVDFIWGSARVALFENSEIRSLGDSQGGGSSTSGGYVLQARVTSSSYPGFIFLNSKLTRAPGPAGNSIGAGKTYLARSGFSSGSNNLDSFAFINCAMDAHIAPVGWFSESGKTRNPLKGTASYGFREYGSVDLSGTKLNLSSRDGAYILSQAEYNQGYANRSQLFSSFNNGQGWNPQP
ncbi:MAG TPA: pectinesterase family protein, partial [Marinagarivorans sp.]|nr:pectinesterase family protein [Marinagarivorans sp.]